MTVNDARILRECSVDLVRASDLTPTLARQRVESVIRDLIDVRGRLNAELRNSDAMVMAAQKRRAA